MAPPYDSGSPNFPSYDLLRFLFLFFNINTIYNLMMELGGEKCLRGQLFASKFFRIPIIATLLRLVTIPYFG